MDLSSVTYLMLLCVCVLDIQVVQCGGLSQVYCTILNKYFQTFRMN